MLISVIIPAYNEEENIGNCLHALMNQDFSREKYEVIVIDDGSTDNTPHIVDSFPGVRLLRQKNQGPAKARNWGAWEAKGEFILFTDADCVPHENWITEIMKSFEENADIIAVKGSFETRQTKLISRFAQIEYLDKDDKLKKEPYIDFVGTDSAGYRSEVFLQAGGFDTVFPQASAEDVELSYRLANQGYKIIFNPRAKVYHLHAESLMDYWKKKYKFAYWRIVAVKKHPNKIWKDSHTPQSMKIQLLLTPLLLTSVVALPLLGWAGQGNIFIISPDLSDNDGVYYKSVSKRYRNRPVISLFHFTKIQCPIFWSNKWHHRQSAIVQGGCIGQVKRRQEKNSDMEI